MQLLKAQSEIKRNKSIPVTPSFRQAAALELARRYFISFIVATYRGYEINWHHRDISDALTDVLEGRCKRLMIFTPPRHGKSEQVSVRFPSYALGRCPEKNVIATSYGDKLAQVFGGKARDIVASPLFKAIFPNVRINASTGSKTEWALERKIVDKDSEGRDIEKWIPAGGYIGAGIGGPITGRGADIGIIDDPIKNQEEAESETYRDRVWEWYRSTFYTRLEKGGAVILMMTRWHKDDLAGRLLEEAKKGGDQWRVIKLPAVATEDSPQRHAGEALWDNKYNSTTLAQIKTVIGTRHFSALYQQEPTEEEGGVWKRSWWKRVARFDVVPWVTVHSWDTAWEQTDGSAYTCCQRWAKSDLGYYLLSSERWKIQYPEIKLKMKELYKRDKPDGVLVEYKASGIAAVQELQREGDIPVVRWPREGEQMGSKLVRALAQSPLAEAGQVWLVGDGVFVDENGNVCNWIDEFIDEAADFPNGAYKDQIDAAAQALAYLKDSAGVGTVMALQGVSCGVGRAVAATHGDDE